MDDERKVLSCRCVEGETAAGTANLAGKADQLFRNDLVEWRSYPSTVGEHRVGARQRSQPHFQRLLCLRKRLAFHKRPRNYALHDRKQVARPVTQFAKQKLLMFI